MSDARGVVAESVRRAEAVATDREVTIALLSIGLVTTALVAMQSFVWHTADGTNTASAAPLTLLPQCVVFAATAVVCVRRMMSSRSARWIAVAGGVITALVFWTGEFQLLLAMPDD